MNKNIGFIGCGNMGSAMISGIVKAEIVPSDRIYVYDHHENNFDKVKEYIEKYKEDGIVWFLEIFEMSTQQVFLHLWQLKNAGYFEHCKGIILGRPLMIREDYGVTYDETIKEALRDLNIPVVYDADIGHVAPQMPIVSGGIIEVNYNDGKGNIKNYFK